MKVVVVFIIIVIVSCVESQQEQQRASFYTIPQPKIEVYRPRGLRVSIPDEDGIRLFAFHGAVNRNLNGLEAGDMSKDILKKQDGRWIFEDRRIRLNLADTLNFWLFVIKDNLGYRLDDQSFIVTENSPAPPGFQTGPNKHKTSTIAPSELYATNAAGINLQHSPPITTVLQSGEHAQCVCPQQSATLIPVDCAESTTTPPPSLTLPENVQNWRELALNYSRENAHLRSQLLQIQEDKTYLVNKLGRIGDVNVLKLILTSGNTESADSAIMQVQTVLREKYGIDNFHIVRDAVCNTNGTITFQLNTLEDKLYVLRRIKEKPSTRFTIEDLN